MFDEIVEVLKEIEGGKEMEEEMEEKGREKIMIDMKGMKEREKKIVEIEDGEKLIFERRKIEMEEKEE